MTAKTFVLLCIYLFSFSGIGFAQETSGNLEGRVTDTTGIPLSGVNIAIQSESLQGIGGTLTNTVRRTAINLQCQFLDWK